MHPQMKILLPRLNKMHAFNLLTKWKILQGHQFPNPNRPDGPAKKTRLDKNPSANRKETHIFFFWCVCGKGARLLTTLVI